MKPTNNLNEKYSISTIAIHWLSTLLILILFPLGIYMSNVEPSEKLGLIQTHAMLGIAIFILTLIRTWVFFKKNKPTALKTGSNFNDKLIVWIHNLFYILLFAITLSGIITMVGGGYIKALEINDANLIQDENDIKALKAHGTLSFIMMILLVAHIAGVIKHYIKTKENTLKRILP